MSRHPLTDLERFTKGDCHFLARALQCARQDLTICTFVFDYCDPTLHAFVTLPHPREGIALDVQGLCTLEVMTERWTPNAQLPIKPITWDELSRSWPGPLDRLTHERAAVTARRLLEEHGLLPSVA